jgi:hypothetical protein
VLPKNFDRHDDLKEEVPHALDFASVQGPHARLIYNYYFLYQLSANNTEEFQGLQTNRAVLRRRPLAMRASF